MYDLKKTCMNHKPMKNSRAVSKDDLKPFLFLYKKSQLLLSFSTKEPWYSFPWSRKRTNTIVYPLQKQTHFSFLALFFLLCPLFLSLFLLHQIPESQTNSQNLLSFVFVLFFYHPHARPLPVCFKAIYSPYGGRVSWGATCNVFWLWVIDGLDACGGALGMRGELGRSRLRLVQLETVLRLQQLVTHGVQPGSNWCSSAMHVRKLLLCCRRKAWWLGE